MDRLSMSGCTVFAAIIFPDGGVTLCGHEFSLNKLCAQRGTISLQIYDDIHILVFGFSVELSSALFQRDSCHMMLLKNQNSRANDLHVSANTEVM